ncbi:MAG: hypothetical protein ACK5KR_05705 [Breznakia sp.]
MKPIDIVVLILALAIVLYVAYKRVYKIITKKRRGIVGCETSSCAGCCGCGESFKELRKKGKAYKKAHEV